MKYFYLYIALFFVIVVHSQTTDSIPNTVTDTTLVYNIQLEEVVVTKKNKDLEEAIRRYKILKKRVYKTYPYAKKTAEKLVQLNETMLQLKTKKEKKKYFKIVEKYLTQEFEPKLKKLSRKDGRILVKLIHRQTGLSTFNLIKEYKSGWKAFWSNNTAKLFKINLKQEYNPFDVVEDYYIENILVNAFKKGRLLSQESVQNIDLETLTNSWKEKEKSK